MIFLSESLSLGALYCLELLPAAISLTFLVSRTVSNETIRVIKYLKLCRWREWRKVRSIPATIIRGHGMPKYVNNTVRLRDGTGSTNDNMDKR